MSLIIQLLVLAFILIVGFLVGSLSVHAYPSWDWKVGGVHDWLRKRITIAIRWRDRVAEWFGGKKSRA